MKNSIHVLLATALFLSGCTDKVSFSSMPMQKASGSDDSTYVDPDTPVIPVSPVTPPLDDSEIPVAPVTPPAAEPLQEFKGACPDGRDGNGRLTSCLSCPPAQTQPDLSSKAKRLLDVMDRACRIANRSQPENYAAPSRDELIYRLRACNPQIYPDTVLTKEENAVIPPLAAGDSALLNRMFSGLWYQPPYSDAFDHYFGLGVEEAVPLFCYKTVAGLNGELWSRAMWEESIHHGFVFEWPKELRELHAYYQNVRRGLKNCLDREGRGGPSGPINRGGVVVSQPKCDVKSYTGQNAQELRTRASELLADGFTVSLENSVSCLMVTDANMTNGQVGSVTLAGMKCQ